MSTHMITYLGNIHTLNYISKQLSQQPHMSIYAGKVGTFQVVLFKIVTCVIVTFQNKLSTFK